MGMDVNNNILVMVTLSHYRDEIYQTVKKSGDMPTHVQVYTEHSGQFTHTVIITVLSGSSAMYNV